MDSKPPPDLVFKFQTLTDEKKGHRLFNCVDNVFT